MVEKTCVVCGEVFKPRGPQKCCSKACQKLNNANRRREYHKSWYDRNMKLGVRIGLCPVCGKNFDYQKKSKKHCSAHCYNKAKRADNLEEHRLAGRERMRALRHADPEGYRQKARDYYAKNAAHIRALNSKRYHENPEPKKARERLRRAADPLAFREAEMAKYYADHEATLTKNRLYREKNADRIRAYARSYYRENPEPAREYGRMYARKNRLLRSTILAQDEEL